MGGRYRTKRGYKNIVLIKLSVISYQVTIRVNGGMHKSQQEFVMEFSNEDKPSLRAMKKETCKRFGCKEKASNSVIYNKQGIQLFDEDIDFIKADDVLYIALDGKLSSSNDCMYASPVRAQRLFHHTSNLILLC